ncbi:MAG: ASKHA domain-containing protein, partial [Phycisphaerae bacterium]
VEYSVIGGAEPIGLCGSALVDATAELLRSGIVNSAGRMVGPGNLPDGLPEALRRRVVLGAGGQPAFVLAEGAAEDALDVTITQRDIRELQLATGAIRAGMVVLLRQAHLEVGDLQRVLIAGGFGSFIRRSNAQRIGLLPPGVDHGRILHVGNTSLSGAKWALASTDARRRADELARLAEHVELSQDANFQAEFAEAMIFPGE